MPLITETYYLSLTQDNRGILRLRCSQDDTLRTVNLKLYNNGSIFTIPSGISAYISGVKQNGAVFSKSCTISQDRKSVVIQLSSDITNVDGVIIAEIVLNDGNGDRLGTSNFIIQVEKNPTRAGVVQDTETPIEYVNDFITQIQALTARVNNLITPNGDPSLAEVVDARISSLDNNTYQNLKARIDADIATLNTRKANKSEVYTKAQVDTLLDNVEIDVDGEFSDESENPVQNKVVAGAISEIKADLDVIIKDKNVEIDTTKYVNLSGFFIGGAEPHDIGTSNGVSMMYVPCSPDTTYTINKISSARFMVAYTKETPARLVATYGFKTFGMASSAIFTTGSDAVYLCVYYKHDSDTLSENTIYNSIEIYENGKELNSGIWSAEAKNALLACLERVYWNDPDGRNQYLNVLRTALNVSNRRSDLPAAYTQVEYIYGSGTQWATFGIVSQIPFKTKAKVLYTAYDANIFTGDSSAVSNNGSAFRFFSFSRFGSNENIKDIGVRIGNNNWIYSPGYVLNTVYDIECGVYKSGNDNIAYVQVGENEKVEGVLDNAPTVGYPMRIYKRDGDSWIGRGAYIYSLICYAAGNQKIFDGIPCYRKADNVSGLYDTVTGIFYPSEGTDNFNIGSVIE